MFGNGTKAKVAETTITITVDAAELARLQDQADALAARQDELQREINAAQAELDALTVDPASPGAIEQAFTRLTGVIGSRQALLRGIEAQRPGLMERLALAKEAFRKAEWTRLGQEVDARSEALAVSLLALAVEAREVEALARKRVTYSHKGPNAFFVSPLNGLGDSLQGMATVVSPSAQAKFANDLRESQAQFDANVRKKQEATNAAWRREQQLQRMVSDSDRSEWA